VAAEINRTFAAAVLSPSPTIAAGALALAEAEASTDTWSIELLSHAHLDVNIESASQIASREHGSQIRRLQLSCAVFAIAAVFTGWQTLRYMDAKSKASKAEASATSALNTLKQIRDGEKAKADQSLNLSKILARAFQPGQSLGDALTVATNDAPKGAWLTGFSIDRGKALTLRGTALSWTPVGTYQDSLVAEQDGDYKRFRDVKRVFANATEVEKTPVVQFSLSAFPTANLPLVDLTAKKGTQK